MFCDPGGVVLAEGTTYVGAIITFVGLADAGIVRPGSPLVQLGVNGSLVGWPIFVFVATFVVLAVLYMRKVRGAMLWAIFGGTVLAVILEAAAKIGAVSPDHATGWALNVPAFPGWQAFASPDLSLLGKVDVFGGFATDGTVTVASVLTASMLVFSLLLADFFDTMGTVVAVGAEGGILNKAGEPPHLREILLVDSLAALAGGAASVSSNTSYVESTAGVAEGARTGIASIVTGVGFLVALFITPIVNMVPSEAVAPVLVVVGFLMMTQVTEIPWSDIEIALPAFVTIAFMPFTYSITVGIGAGFIMFVVMKIFQGKAAKVHVLMWIVAALFAIYFMQGLITGAFA